MIRLCYADGMLFPVARCELTADELLSDDNEAYLSSSAFILREAMNLVLVYNISSYDIAVDAMIVSQSTQQVLEWHSLPHRRTFHVVHVPSTEDSLYLRLRAYSNTSTTTSSSSSVNVFIVMLVSHDEC